MANCPKCGNHLKITDWHQRCPHCGVNMILYDEQERMMQDADIAEVQHYYFQRKIDRVKGAFVGTKLAIVRLIMFVIPLIPIFLPLVKATVVDPFNPMDGGISFLTIYNNISVLNADTFGKAMAMAKTPTVMLLVSLGLFLLSLLTLLLRFILLTLACSPKGKQRNISLDVILLASTVASAILFATMPAGGAIKGTLAIGTYLYLLLQLASAVIDIIILKKGIEIKLKQCYVGGIPIEEYFEMQKKGMTTAEIRVIQYDRLAKIQAEKEARMKKEAEEAEKKEAEEESVNA